MGSPATGHIEPPRRFIASPVRTSEVNVFFTTLRGTLAAMRAAAALSRASDASVRLIDPRPVYFPLRAAGYALAAAPAQSIEEREREQVIAAAGVPVGVQVFVCGHPANAARALYPHSFVILGGRRSWWPTSLERFQRSLESQGHAVMFVNETEN